MNELGREAKALFAAARHGDSMAPADKARVRGKLVQRLGTGVAVGTALTAGSTAAHAARLTGLSGTTALLPSVAKVVGIVVVTSATTLGVMHVVHPFGRSATAPKTQQVAPVPQAPVLPSPIQLLAQVPAPLKVEPNLESPAKHVPAASTAIAPSQTPGTSQRGPQTVAAVRAVDELSQEVAAIRESRAAIRRGDAKAALDALDRANVAPGPLDQEVQLARISAYCLQGDVARARSLAEQLLQRFPDSLLSSRVRDSCAFDQIKGR